ncbi:HD domain-containing protein [Phycicoccus avicenniae]|uniref:HD domain-containing protein n=1 Tax=Phycicoccus avicenniae TaxID=2828860 RepID=UPI003D29AD14
MHALQGRWPVDSAPVLTGADPDAVAAVGADLVHRWSEPHRRYHDLTHLTEVLAAVDALSRSERLGEDDRSVARLAAWFHDAVHAGATDGADERGSADLAARSMRALGAGEGVVERVVRLVLDTVEHDVEADGGDRARPVLHDADLWILSAPVTRFDDYCRQVRAEYARVGERDYAAGRTAVLRPFLVRPHVYVTPYARREWEPAARENLARELTRLAG